MLNDHEAYEEVGDECCPEFCDCPCPACTGEPYAVCRWCGSPFATTDAVSTLYCGALCRANAADWDRRIETAAAPEPLPDGDEIPY